MCDIFGRSRIIGDTYPCHDSLLDINMLEIIDHAASANNKIPGNTVSKKEPIMFALSVSAVNIYVFKK
jgi:hypothetical protein